MLKFLPKIFNLIEFLRSLLHIDVGFFFNGDLRAECSLQRRGTGPPGHRDQRAILFLEGICWGLNSGTPTGGILRVRLDNTGPREEWPYYISVFLGWRHKYPP